MRTTTELKAFMKQRRMGLNDFIQRLATSNSYTCKHPEVQSIVNLAPQQQEAELMNANPSPPPSPSQQMNLGPSSNPTAKPSDFHFLKVIGKGSFGKVLLARHRTDDQFYAVKVLQKKAILKKKEVPGNTHTTWKHTHYLETHTLPGNTHTHRHTQTNTHTHRHTHTDTQTDTHTTCKHTHTQTHTDTQTHRQTHT
uniref:non-specific serine/threonine protein kinase n=1 Tax=Hucho hucho TaxID=62062 RepID=A0A4W5LSZ8_9TELE